MLKLHFAIPRLQTVQKKIHGWNQLQTGHILIVWFINKITFWSPCSSRFHHHSSLGGWEFVGGGGYTVWLYDANICTTLVCMENILRWMKTYKPNMFVNCDIQLSDVTYLQRMRIPQPYHPTHPPSSYSHTPHHSTHPSLTPSRLDTSISGFIAFFLTYDMCAVLSWLYQ